MLKSAKHQRTSSKIRLNRDVIRVLRLEALESAAGGGYQTNGVCTSYFCSDACPSHVSTIQ